MSKSIALKAKYIDQKDAYDPLEAATWAELKITLGEYAITRVWDRTTSELRDVVYVPTFPIVQWIVENWWCLLNEPSRSERVPKSGANTEVSSWNRRHCLRSADSALLLPKLCLFNDGSAISASWNEDHNDSLPNMPAYFLTSGAVQLTKEDTVESLSQFVKSTLDRLAGINDERLNDLTTQWNAIIYADADEVSFCVIAGRMGLNPYDPTEVTAAISNAICLLDSDSNRPIIRDLTECASPDLLAGEATWIREASRELSLQKMPDKISGSLRLPERRSTPHQFGYDVARYVRNAAGLDTSEPVDDILKVAANIFRRPFLVENRNHLPGKEIRGIVGWTQSDGALMAGPPTGREATQRFAEARGFFHAMCSCGLSERLVTSAYTWDQRASRSFAAEFLAPQATLRQLTTSRADIETIDELAAKFRVSSQAISLQLENAGVEIVI